MCVQVAVRAYLGITSSIRHPNSLNRIYLQIQMCFNRTTMNIKSLKRAQVKLEKKRLHKKHQLP